MSVKLSNLKVFEVVLSTFSRGAVVRPYCIELALVAVGVSRLYSINLFRLLLSSNELNELVVDIIEE